MKKPPMKEALFYGGKFKMGMDIDPSLYHTNIAYAIVVSSPLVVVVLDVSSILIHFQCKPYSCTVL